MIEKKTYEQLATRLLLLQGISLLTGSETTLPTDPTDGTEEALSKGDDDFWDGAGSFVLLPRKTDSLQKKLFVYNDYTFSLIFRI